MTKPYILVIGSISIDYVVECDKRPLSGETYIGTSFHTYFGGKGANQAVACARLGCEVKFLGCVGKDDAGMKCIQNLKQNKIDTSYIKEVDEETGSAHIVVADKDNSIIVVPGANLHCSKEQIDAALSDKPALVILQNEIAMTSVEYAIEQCFENNIPIIYNPAPAKTINMETVKKATYITPNESEFDLLFQGETRDKILSQMPNQLILTLGEDGVALHNGDEEQQVEAYKVEVVDTTGAGDTFNGALAYGLINNYSLNQSIKMANLAAALSIQKKGAQGGIPTIDEMKESKMYEKEWNIKSRY